MGNVRGKNGAGWHWPLLPSFPPQAFGRYLGPDERTGVVLEAIEILGRSNLMNKDGPREFLEEAMNSPEMWLTDVSDLWWDCFALEPCQVPASIPPSQRDVPEATLRQLSQISLTCSCCCC